MFGGESLGSREYFMTASFQARGKLPAGLALLILVAGLFAPLAAQQARWKDLNTKAESLLEQRKYAEALPVAQQALRVAEAEFGPTHPNVATSLNDLALLYEAERKFASEEPLLKRSLAITEKVAGPGNPDVAARLNDLAQLYYEEGSYAQATTALWQLARRLLARTTQI